MAFDQIHNDAVDLWVENRNERSVSSATSLDAADERINVDTSGGTFPVELADTGDLQTPTGKRIVFDHTTGNDLFTITPKSGDANSATINGVASFTVPLSGLTWIAHLYQNNWYVVALYVQLEFLASHDRQSVNLTGPITTTSATFEDIAGAILTPVDLGESGTYLVDAVINLTHSNPNRDVTIRLVVNGSPVGNEFSVSSETAMAVFPMEGLWSAPGVNASDDIKLQWKTTMATATINVLTMIIDGIPDSALKP